MESAQYSSIGYSNIDDEFVELMPPPTSQAPASTISDWCYRFFVIIAAMLMATSAAFLFYENIYINSVGKDMNNNNNGYNNFLSLYNRWYPTCSDPVTNSMMARGGAIDVDAEASRDWSINLRSFDHSQPACRTMESLLESSRRGERFLLNPQIPLNATGSELSPSPTSFRPYQCSPRFPTSDEMCDEIHKFAHLTIVGDSLSRHMVQALHTLLKQDLRFGAFPYLSDNSGGLYDRCQCDGQFSEHATCRAYSSPNIFSIADLRSLGFCYPRPVINKNSTIRESFHPTRLESHFHGFDISVNANNYHYLCLSSMSKIDKRPRLVVLQAALHYHNDANTVIAWVKRMMEVINYVGANCASGPINVHYLYIGATAQIRSMDLKYPHQSRESAIIFNNEVSQHFKKNYNLSTINFLPLTRNAQSSDGLHHLSDVNMVKAVYIYNYMKLLNIDEEIQSTRQNNHR